MGVEDLEGDELAGAGFDGLPDLAESAAAEVRLEFVSAAGPQRAAVGIAVARFGRAAVSSSKKSRSISARRCKASTTAMQSCMREPSRGR